MKKTLLIIGMVAMVGCVTNVPIEPLKNITIDGSNVKVITIDSCEYIYIPLGYSSWGSHKGNCKFCKQRNSLNQ